MVDRAEIDQMAKFMGAINGSSSGSSSEPPNRATAGGDNIAEMKLILERFHATASDVIAEAPRDRDLRDSLNMELTETGAQYGGWEIIVKKSGNRSLYDVIHTATSEKIAADLMLYEAAVGLVRHLNDDGYVNSRELLEMLKAEQDYAGAVNDMVIYKHHLTKTPNSARAPIYEARYGVAKRKAVASRDQVYRLSARL
jgi:hypothetical protein